MRLTTTQLTMTRARREQARQKSPNSFFLTLAVGLGAFLLFADLAHAYPQFQLATGNTRCNQCHYAPAGGGLISPYGRDESEGSLSMTAGSGAFMHGLFELPEWLALGVDLRSAAVIKDSRGTNPQAFVFPMQADLYSRFAIGEAFSWNMTLGMRGAARGATSPVGLRFLSREHFLMWQPEDETGWYIRAGRFFAPYGLRLQDHTAYVRRFLGQHTLEETYNLSFGRIEDEWELHATVFTPPSTLGVPFFLGGDVGTPSSGLAVYYERRLRDETAAVGAQSKVEIGADNNIYWVGGVGKLFLEDASLLLLSELDLGLQTFSFGVNQQVVMLAHLSATYFLTQGLFIGAALERYDQHVELSGSARDSANLTVQWLFRSHWELMAMGKLDMQQNFGSVVPSGMLMLHYYL